MHDDIQTGVGVCQLLEGRVGSSDNKAGRIKSLRIGKLKIVRQHFQSHREQNHIGPLWEWDIHTLLLIKTKQNKKQEHTNFPIYIDYQQLPRVTCWRCAQPDWTLLTEESCVPALFLEHQSSCQHVNHRLIASSFISHPALLQLLVNLVHILNDACSVLGVCV